MINFFSSFFDSFLIDYLELIYEEISFIKQGHRFIVKHSFYRKGNIKA